MKIHRALATTGMLSIAVFAFTLVPALAANSPPPMQATKAAQSNDPAVATQMREIDAQVRKIEQALPTLARTEVMLKPGSLADVTEVKWSKLHAYASGNTIERLKVYPPAGSAKTEEFYYQDGSLILAFVEPNGAAHEGHSPEAKGTRYYFNANGLFANNDGKRTTTTPDAKQKAKGAKLQRESAALLGLSSKSATDS
ncbi:MAG: hypothetical protein ABI379_12335 [Rhodanobacter sp.]